MPAKKKSKDVEAVVEEPWIPTRAPYLADNPFAHLTKEEAYTKLTDRLRLLDKLQWEVDQLRRIVLSFNIMYYDQDGNVCRAE
jgi:hypothetical protein